MKALSFQNKISASLMKISLKRRILTIFYAFFALSSIAFITLSGYTINRLLTKQIAESFKNSLHQSVNSINTAITNLNLVSQQLAFSSDLQNHLHAYLECTDSREKSSLYYSLQKDFLDITFSNTSIGLFYYFDTEAGEYYLNNLPLSYKTLPEHDVPIFTTQNDMVYMAPHTSFTRFNGNPVISLIRKMELLDKKSFYLYVESGYSTIKDILSFNNSNESKLVILDPDDLVVYSEAPEAFQLESTEPSSFSDTGRKNGYYWFRESSDFGYTLLSLIPVSSYQKEAVQWIFLIIVFFLLFLILAIFLGFMLWRMVCRPLQVFDNELDYLLTQDNQSTAIAATHIPEYDYLLLRIQTMKKQINQMFNQIVEQEKQHSKTEIGKLRYQINPHFLMNTLNTVHWLALMNEQSEIDHVIQSLSHLLAYNLDKTGTTANIEQELKAVAEYVNLQKIRYHFDYQVMRVPEDAILDYPCPKFILQPLIENSLHHGYKENMSLQISITVYEKIKIVITDTGVGIPPDKVYDFNYLYSHENLYDDTLDSVRNKCLGIGMKYVLQSLENFFEDAFDFHIESIENKGTSLVLIFPKMKGSGYVDQNIDC